MLFGEDAGGGHEGHLRTRLKHNGGGQSGHNSFAGADIALKQAVHGAAGAQITFQVGQGFTLGVGQLIRQTLNLFIQPARGRLEHLSGERLPALLLALNAELEQKDFIKGQAAAGGREAVH